MPRVNRVMSPLLGLTIIAMAVADGVQAQAPSPRVASAPTAERHRAPEFTAAEIAVVRRQPKDLLDGISLSRSQRKAVYGVVRRNGSDLASLETRHRRAAGTAADAEVGRDVVALRDKERAELRAILTPRQRHRFDQNLVRLNR